MSVSAGLVLRGRYELGERVGAGMQGEVWKARDRQHDRAVALKSRLALETDASELLEEARVLLDLTPHSALPTVRDDFFELDRYWIVMEWVDGTSLRGTTPAADVTIEHLSRVASALDHLHSHSPAVLHRDVKPDNVVVGQQGAVLVDFGLAGAAKPGGGSAAFLAPEVIAGEAASAASDLYALAVTAHVMLTGDYPEAGRTPRFDGVSDADADRMVVALGVGLSVDPARRPASCTAFVDSLRPPEVASNLPASVTSFVGREDDLAAAEHAAVASRIITFVGVGGSGKTALALEFARRRLSRHPDGVWFVDLASIRDDGVATAVRAGMRIEPASLDPTADVIAGVARNNVLLILDTCETGVSGAAGLVDALLAGCPNALVVATSRESLRVPGERVLSVESLADRDGARLLVERAEQAGAAATDPGDAGVLAIVVALDGLPLALELAALRVPQLGIDGVKEGLERRLDLLAEGARTRPRHETMRAAIDWSWQLLSPAAQACLRRLSVFAGGFEAEAAPAVVGEQASALEELVARSMVWNAGERYRLPDVVREFAWSALRDAGEAIEIVDQHQQWCLGVVRDVEAGRTDRVRRATVMARAERENDNLVGAAEAGGPTAVTIAQGMWATWREQGRHREARRLIEASLQTVGDSPLDDRVAALQKLGDLCSEMGDLDEGETWLLRAASEIDASTSARGAAAVFNSLGAVAGRRGDYLAALDYFERGAQVEGLEPAMQGFLRRNVAIAASRLGRLDDAVATLEEDVAMSEDRGDVPGLMNGLASLGEIESTRGEFARAEPFMRRALELAVVNDARGIVGLLLANLVVVWHIGAPRVAGLALGAANAELRRTGQSTGADTESYLEVQALVRAALGADFDDVVAQGEEMTASDVLALGAQL